MGSILGYAIEYIPATWKKPSNRSVPSYEKLIITNLSYGEWLMILIITLIFLSISKLYEEKQAMLLPSEEEAKELANAILEMTGHISVNRVIVLWISGGRKMKGSRLRAAIGLNRKA